MPKVRLLAEAMPRVNTRYENGQTINDVTIKRKGDVFDLSPEDVDRLLPHGSIELVDEGPGDDSEGQGDPAEKYSEAHYTFADLQNEAKNRGLSAGGSRDEIIARLVEDDQKS